jgi:hypothetical protein
MPANYIIDKFGLKVGVIRFQKKIINKIYK